MKSLELKKHEIPRAIWRDDVESVKKTLDACGFYEGSEVLNFNDTLCGYSNVCFAAASVAARHDCLSCRMRDLLIDRLAVNVNPFTFASLVAVFRGCDDRVEAVPDYFASATTVVDGADFLKAQDGEFLKKLSEMSFSELEGAIAFLCPRCSMLDIGLSPNTSCALIRRVLELELLSDEMLFAYLAATTIQAVEFDCDRALFDGGLRLNSEGFYYEEEPSST